MINIRLFLLIPLLLFSKQKILHLTFHNGCEGEIKEICKAFDLELDTWNILKLKKNSFNGVTNNSYNYIMTHDTADLIYQKHKSAFEKYDLIITSDIAPLSRIFLQNNWTKPLIIWVCNRFDMNARCNGDRVFPDKEYLDLFDSAKNLPNVEIIGYTDYERVHAEKNRFVFSIGQTINPTGLYSGGKSYHAIPKKTDKKKSFFIRKYINEKKVGLAGILNKQKTQNYCGSYAGSSDLKDFKGMVHIPCVMSNFHLFENLSKGVIHYIPSKEFYRHEYEAKRYQFWDWTKSTSRTAELPVEEIFAYCDWYRDDLAPLFVYFDSYEEIPLLARRIDTEKRKKEIALWHKNHVKNCLHSWEAIFKRLIGEEQLNKSLF